MDFDSVWVSSRAHLEQFVSIVRDAPLRERLMGRYTIPAGFPYRDTTQRLFTRLVLGMPGAIVPLKMFAAGILSVDFEHLDFASTPSDGDGVIRVRDFNLRDDFSFSLAWSDVVSVDRFDEPKIGIWLADAMFRLPWAVVRTRRDDELREILLGIGQSGRMRTRSPKDDDQLLAVLQHRLTIIRTAKDGGHAV